MDHEKVKEFDAYTFVIWEMVKEFKFQVHVNSGFDYTLNKDASSCIQTFFVVKFRDNNKHVQVLMYYNILYLQ